jgi:hypothetical protein
MRKVSEGEMRIFRKRRNNQERKDKAGAVGERTVIRKTLTTWKWNPVKNKSHQVRKPLEPGVRSATPLSRSRTTTKKTSLPTLSRSELIHKPNP